MRRILVNNVPHIEPYKYIYPELDVVKTSCNSKSETRYVKVININLKDYPTDFKRDKPIVMVDSPGSEDTESVEVEISNCLGII